jgi:hypothetical protein
MGEVGASSLQLLGGGPLGGGRLLEGLGGRLLTGLEVPQLGLHLFELTLVATHVGLEADERVERRQVLARRGREELLTGDELIDRVGEQHEARGTEPALHVQLDDLLLDLRLDVLDHLLLVGGDAEGAGLPVLEDGDLVAGLLPLLGGLLEIGASRQVGVVLGLRVGAGLLDLPLGNREGSLRRGRDEHDHAEEQESAATGGRRPHGPVILTGPPGHDVRGHPTSVSTG